MKKTLLSLVMLCMCMMAGAEANYVLREGFEGGKLPDGWTMEYVSGQQDWTVESGDLTYPSGTTEGLCRIAIRNNTTQTIGFVTKLISPVMDISEVIDPIVVFAHAQQQRTGDYEKLKVYYRSAPDRDWIELKSFDNKIPAWRYDTVMLDAKSKTYQIAFEVADNMGRGVVLDDVRVRAMPTCSDPSDIKTDGLTTTSFRLVWNGSLDTDSFEIAVSESAITDMSALEDITLVIHTFVDPTEAGFVFETGDVLKQSKRYYVYMRALCSGETSAWVEYQVTTKNIVDVPYFQNFDMPYVSGTLNHPNYWTCGTSYLNDKEEMEYMPFINTNENGTSWAQKSLTGTSCLVFTGARSTTTAIDPGQYVYAATPEMNVDDMSKLTVSFWGTAYTYFGLYNKKDYESGLIVGVMTDPADVTTFVAVDTVHARSGSLFEQYHVSLASYKGAGKYVAFASYFQNKYNIYYLDDVSIDYTPEVAQPTDVQITVLSSSKLNISAALGDADKWNIVVAKAGVAGEIPPTAPVDSLILAKAENLAVSDNYIFTSMNFQGQALQVYVQAVKGGKVSDWALPVKVVMPDYITTYPTLLTFATKESKWTYKDTKGNYAYGTLSTAYPAGILYEYNTSKYGTVITSTSGQYIQSPSIYWITSANNAHKVTYFSLPEVEDVKKTFISFWLGGPSSPSSYHAPHVAMVEVGVMNDPYDPSSFVALATYEGQYGELNKFSCNFGAYEGEGKFIAFRAVNQPVPPEQEGSSSYDIAYGFIDNITIDMLDDCTAPLNIKENVYSDSIELTWDAVGQNSWKVNVYAGAEVVKLSTYASEYKPIDSTLVASISVTEPKAMIKGLSPITTYYYQIIAACEDTTDLKKIATDCPAKGYAIPYVEDFEKYEGNEYTSSTTSNRKLPDCWNSPIVSYSSGASGESSSYYPYISHWTSSGYTHSGSNTFVFGYPYNYYDMYVALPEMADSINSLQMSFWLKPVSASYADSLEIGVMSDPTDLKTFQVVDKIYVTGASQYNEYIVSLTKYVGISRGHHIAIHRPKDLSHYYYIDDVKIKYASNCGVKVQGIIATTLEDAIAFEWAQQDNISDYELLIAKSEIENIEEDIPAELVVLRKNVKNNRDTVNMTEAAFIPNTDYYVYMRTACSATNVGEWSAAAKCKTACVAQTPEAFGVETFDDAARFGCWTPGINKVYTAGGEPAMNAKLMPATNSTYLYLMDAKFTTTANKEKGGQSYVITPTFNLGDDKINQYEIRFQAHKAATLTYGGRLGIGVVVDDFESYQQVGMINLQNVPSVAADANYGFNEAPYYTVRFTDYMGDEEGRFGKRIALVSLGNKDSANYVYADNLSVLKLGTVTEPISVTIPDSTNVPGSTVVNWDAQSMATGYEVKYATAPINPDTDEPLVEGTKVVVKTMDVTTNTATLTGLQGVTWYYVYVRSTDGANKSIWSNMRKFKSSCPVAYTLPYFTGFEESTVAGTTTNKLHPDCWLGYYEAQTATTAYPLEMGTAKYEGINGLLVGGTKAPKYSYAVMPMIDADLSKVMISFYYKSNSTSYEAQLDLGIVSDPSSLEKIQAEFKPLETIKTKSGDFSKFQGTFETYEGEGKYIVLRGTNNGNTSYYGMCVDNVMVEKIPTCFPVSKVEQITATTSSITLNIVDDIESQTAWDVVFVAPGKDPEDGTPVSLTINDTIDGGYFLFEGLPHSTTYDVYARANCGGGDLSKWSDVATAKTLVKVALDKAFWDFDDPSQTTQIGTSATYILENGWMAGNMKSTSSSYIPYNVKNTINATSGKATTKYSYSGDYALKLYNYKGTGEGAYAILPAIDGNLDELQIRFKVRSAYHNDDTRALTKTYQSGTTYTYEISVGSVTNPYDISTYSEIYHYDLPALSATSVDEDETGMLFWSEVTASLFGTKGSNLVLMVNNSNKSGYAYVDDVIVEKEQGCGTPGGLNVVDSTFAYNYADLVWVSNKLKWQLQLFEGDNDSVPVIDSTMSVEKITYETQFALKNLQPNTDYTVKVRSICGDEDMSEWVVKTFKTPCAPMEKADATWNFEDDLYQYGSSATYLIPQCWTVRAAKTTLSTGVVTPSTTQSDAPYAIVNSTSLYSRGADGTENPQQRAMKFNATYSTTTPTEGWAQLPEMGFSLQKMQMHVFARAAYANKSTKKFTANTNLDRKLYIGYMTDVEDISTFVKVDSIVCANVVAATDLYTDREDGFWEEFFIDLDKIDGHQIVLCMPRATKATSYVYIDDMEIIPEGYCFKPASLTGGNTTSTTAVITWKNAKTTEVQLSTTPLFEDGDIVFSGIATDTTAIEATGLTPGMTYYIQARHICGAEQMSDWVVASSTVTTLYAVRFAEDFQKQLTYPADWSRYSKKMLLATNVSKDGIGSPVAETASSAWKRSPSGLGMKAGHMVMSYSSSTGASTNYWLITPQIDLTKFTEGDKLMLSFDLAYTNADGEKPEMIPDNYFPVFAVAVSTDNKKTWLTDDITAWADAPFGADTIEHIQPGLPNGRDTVYVQPVHGFRNISSAFGGEKFYIDMTKYIGQNISIAFYAESTTPNGGGSYSNVLHMDNVQLNTYSYSDYAETICQWEDYADDNFQIDANDLNVDSTTVYDKLTVSTQLGGDVLTRLSLTVEAGVTTEKSAKICEGTIYDKDGFNFVATKSGVYKQKLQSAINCDSTVILNAEVMPKIVKDSTLTVCQGYAVEFCDSTLHTSGTYTCTYTAESTGCDSVVILHLSVRDIIRGGETKYLCPNGSIEFGDSIITTPGIYQHIFDVQGCDSLATLTVLAAPQDSVVIRAAMWQGEVYDKGAWKGLTKAGNYTIPGTNIYGCDSVTTLHLMVCPMSGTLIDTITTDELPYILNDEELLSKGTEAGSYEKTIEVSGSQMSITIVVDTPTGLEGIYTDPKRGALKVIKNNHLYIIVNDKWIDAVGTRMR